MIVVVGYVVGVVFVIVEIDGFWFFSFEFFGCKVVFFVIVVVEWLGCVFVVGVKLVVFVFFDINGIGIFLGNDGLGLGYVFYF